MDKIKFLKKEKTEGVLFLQGIHKKDCKKIEDFFQDRLLLNDIEQKNIIIYDKLPSIFTGVKTWPERTNLSCNWCCRVCNSFPWFEPQSIEPLSLGTIGTISKIDLKNKHNYKSFSIIPKGVFCCTTCVSANIHRDNSIISDRHNKLEMLKFLYEIVTGLSILEILPSPHPSEMEKYGGNLSETDYQKKINDLSNFIVNPTLKDDFYSIYNTYYNNL